MRRVTLEEAFSFQALWSATDRAARGKRSRAAVARFLLEREGEIAALRDELLQGWFQPSHPRMMEIRDPKPRLISVLPFRDRVVHQAIGAVIEPRMERRFIRDTYACRRGLGTHAALRRARAWQGTYPWVVHLDVERFFPSMDHAIVARHIAEDVPEPALRALCERILDAGEGLTHRAYFPGDDLFSPLSREVGLPLGSLTSQLWANRYLDPIDHLVKDRLRVRAYLRYMDDMVVFHHDRAALLGIARAIEEACWALRLRLHPYDAQPTRGGLSFVGYRMLPGYTRVRRTGVARAEQRLTGLVSEVKSGLAQPEALWESLRSTFSHWDHADTWRLKERLLRRLSILYDPSELIFV